MNSTKLLLIFFTTSYLHALDHPKIKPGRFLAGRQIVSQKGTWQIQPEVQMIKGKSLEELTLDIEIDYGFTRLLGIEVSIPFFLTRKNILHKSGGLADIGVKLEYKAYWVETELITLSLGLHLPTGSRKKRPITGSGTVDILGEFRALHTSDTWYAQSIYKGIFRTERNNKRIGHSFLFDFTVGPQIAMPDRGDSTLLAAAELEGEFISHFKLKNELDNFGGGFVLFFGPTFVWAKGNFILEALFHLPVMQRFPAETKDDRIDFRVAGSFIISF